MQDDIQCELTKLKSQAHSDDDGLSFEQIVSEIVSGVVNDDENLYDDETHCIEDEGTEGHCERQTYVYVSILSEFHEKIIEKIILFHRTSPRFLVKHVGLFPATNIFIR